jgi:hypothetical protein
LRQAQKAYLARLGRAAEGVNPANPGLLRTAYRERLRAAMRIPAVEALFPAPWSVAARSVLPSPSPQLTATEMWGPVLGWCALELLAESIDAEEPERVALDIFDRLRLREPFAQAFALLGFEGEEGWRVAARVKVGLLTGAGVGRPQEEPAPAAAIGERATLWPALWSDADVRWLSGVHQAEGRAFLVRENYEELLWWLLMPSLLRLAGEAAPSRAAVEAMSGRIDEALASAEAAGYRVDVLDGSAAAEAAEEEPALEVDSSAEAEVEADALPSDPLEPSEPPELEIESPLADPAEPA